MQTTFQGPTRRFKWFCWLVYALCFPFESLGCGVDQIKVRGDCVSDPVHERIFDLIAYGTQTNGNGIVMATPIGVGTCYNPWSFSPNPCKHYTGAAPWRFGVISSSIRPNEVELSRSGTKLFVTYASSFDILDLQDYTAGSNSYATKKLKSSSETTPTHRLPSQFYVYRLDDRIHVMDDCKIDHGSDGTGLSQCSQSDVLQPYPLFEGDAAAVSESGRELLVRHDGSMIGYDPRTKQVLSIGMLPSPPQELEVIPAPKGETPEFLVVYRGGDSHYFVVEPGSPSPIVEFSNR
jgi:hypothetical protein